MKMTLRFKGGKGSGDFGHKGRPGSVGGSSSGSGALSRNELDDSDIGGPDNRKWSVTSEGNGSNTSRVVYDRSSRWKEPIKLGEVYKVPMKGWIAKARDRVVNSSDKSGYFKSRRDAINAVNDVLSEEKSK